MIQNVSVMSVPVFDQQQRVVDALSISSPKFRFDNGTVEGNLLTLLLAKQKSQNHLF